MLTTCDNVTHNYSDDVEGVQWYFGSRSSDFILYGVDAFTALIQEYDIQVDSVGEGNWVKKGEPAITLTVNNPESLHLGNRIETLLYNTVWYPSTVGTILTHCKKHLLMNGHDLYKAFPQLGRSSVNDEQTRVAKEMFQKVFYKLNDEPRSVAFHNNVLINGEKYCLENYRSVMVDTFNFENCIKTIQDMDWRGDVIIDSSPIYDNIDYVLQNTSCSVSVAETQSAVSWYEMVQKYVNNKRVFFGIGSFAFVDVSRDTFGLVYKTCAVKRSGEWKGVSKRTKGKETYQGFVEKL